MNPTQVQAAKVDTSPDAAAIRGAAGGAADGTAIGSIGGDAGEGTGIGAVVGGLRGRRVKIANDAQAQEQKMVDD